MSIKKLKDADWNEIKSQYKSGKTLEEIAKYLGPDFGWPRVLKGRIGKELTKLGVKKRTRSEASRLGYCKPRRDLKAERMERLKEWLK